MAHHLEVIIIKHICSFYNIDLKTLLQSKRGSLNWPSLIYMYISRKYFGYSLLPIAHHLGFAHRTTVSTSILNCRWQIEIFFKILKIGCAIEKIQLTEKNFNACLSFYMIIAWRILYVVILGRHCPDISCECIFSKEEWQTTYVVVNRKKPPLIPPKLNDMIRMVETKLIRSFRSHLTSL